MISQKTPVDEEDFVNWTDESVCRHKHNFLVNRSYGFTSTGLYILPRSKSFEFHLILFNSCRTEVRGKCWQLKCPNTKVETRLLRTVPVDEDTECNPTRVGSSSVVLVVQSLFHYHVVSWLVTSSLFLPGEVSRKVNEEIRNTHICTYQLIPFSFSTELKLTLLIVWTKMNMYIE